MYILLISIHGLIRGHDLELGRDADTGGQTLYVTELARVLATRDDVEQVDLVTRRVVDDDVDADYAEALEQLGPKLRIVRIDAGPEAYIAKEQLWDLLDPFTDNLLEWLNRQPRMPDIVHSHYADAGYVGVRVCRLLGTLLVHTGHSLGRDKLQRLMATGLEREDIEQRFNMGRRIDAEEEVLASADLVVTSTHDEVEKQYGQYNYYQPERMAVIPPGTDLGRFRPPAADDPTPAFAAVLQRFLRDPSRPMVLAMSRPDERKNIGTLVRAFGESERLRELANLVVVAGTRDDIESMDSGARKVLVDLLLQVDKYDLYGLVALPKRHGAEDVPQVYRLAVNSGGVFVNCALIEPFGLTLLEAAASGLPLVATENGGPNDIIASCHNGVLVDPLDSEAIAAALLEMLEDPERWQGFAREGLVRVRKLYSWDTHAHSYMEKLGGLQRLQSSLPRTPPHRAPRRYRDRAIFSDLDQTLLGNPSELERFVDVVREHRRVTLLGIATGRRLDSALSTLRRYRIPVPDVLITSLGTEIHYSQAMTADDWWDEHIDHLWKPHRVRRLLSDLPGLIPQAGREQSRFKISYHYDPAKAPSVEEIGALLHQHELTVNVIHAFGQFLDVLPSRASKGLALRYVVQRWRIPLERVLVAGGSGADEDMMRGNTRAVVVANRHHEELQGLRNTEGIYFAEQPFAAGIIEAIEHYDFFAEAGTEHDA